MKRLLFVMFTLAALAAGGQEPPSNGSTVVSPSALPEVYGSQCVLWLEDGKYKYVGACTFERTDLEERIAALEKRVADMERQLGVQHFLSAPGAPANTACSPPQTYIVDTTTGNIYVCKSKSEILCAAPQIGGVKKKP